MYEIIIKEACNGFWSCLTPTNWIQLIAVVIAMMAAIASWFAIFTQQRNHKKNKEPIIVPGIKNVEATIKNILSDWDEEGRVPKKFSNTKLPIWNYGGSPVFNVSYCYYIENIDDLVDTEENEISRISGHSITVIKNETKREDNYDYSLQVKYSNIDQKKGSHSKDILPLLRTVDVIKPNEYSEILLPDYFIIMLNDFFINTHLQDKKQPILQLKIFYDDVNFQAWEQQFRVFIPESFRMKGEELTTSFHYEIIQKKKKRKRLTIQENEKRIKKKARHHK
ncbi:hypothetical protein [Alkalihalobacillus sp. R86527]|uniref:hypothetical protein n=1 Tax=Alkalihalobacillus sp. R86527 TaxID=3093863 RepID=UPI00366CAF79